MCCQERECVLEDLFLFIFSSGFDRFCLGRKYSGEKRLFFEESRTKRNSVVSVSLSINPSLLLARSRALFRLCFPSTVSQSTYLNLFHGFDVSDAADAAKLDTYRCQKTDEDVIKMP